jgi:hypothetical protein
VREHGDGRVHALLRASVIEQHGAEDVRRAIAEAGT